MKPDICTIPDARTIYCSGRLTLEEGIMAVRNTVRDIVQAGARRIVFNLANMNCIDSTGVGGLVHTYTTVTRQGGRVKLLNLTKRIREVLAVSRPPAIFDVLDDEGTLLAAFIGPSIYGSVWNMGPIRLIGAEVPVTPCETAPTIQRSRTGGGDLSWSPTSSGFC